MPEAIPNSSPLLSLYRAGVVDWLPQRFDEIWTPNAVVEELKEGQRRGYDGPLAANYDWPVLLTPASVPSEWLTLDLGMGELETMALALENTERIVILDDALARNIAQAAGIPVWGLKGHLETKSRALRQAFSHTWKNCKTRGCGFRKIFAGVFWPWQESGRPKPFKRVGFLVRPRQPSWTVFLAASRYSCTRLLRWSASTGAWSHGPPDHGLSHKLDPARCVQATVLLPCSDRSPGRFLKTEPNG